MSELAKTSLIASILEGSTGRLLLLQQYVRCCLAEILHVPDVLLNVDESLLDLGVESIDLTRLTHCIQSDLKVSIPFTLLFRDRPVIELLKQLTVLLAQSSTELQRNENFVHSPKSYQLSVEQEGLLVNHCLSPLSAFYNINIVLDINENLDLSRLERAFLVLQSMHSALRTTFSTNKGGSIAIINSKPISSLRSVDLSQLGLIDDELRKEARRPFDLWNGPLIRLTCYSLGSARCLLQLVVHHIIADLWSMALILRDLGYLYSHGAIRSSYLPKSTYAEYIDKQLVYTSSHQNEIDRDYWQNALSVCKPRVNTPSHSPHDNQGASVRFTIDKQLKSSLLKIARAHKVTLQVLLHAFFHLLLSKYDSADFVITGMPTNRRYDVEFRNVVGYFVNVIPIVTLPKNDSTFAAFVTQMHRSILEALSHDLYSLPLILRDFYSVVGRCHEAPFNTVFVYDQDPLPESTGASGLLISDPAALFRFGETIARHYWVDQMTTQNALTLVMANAEDGIGARFLYDAHRFMESKITEYQHTYISLLEAVVSGTIDHLDLFGVEEE